MPPLLCMAGFLTRLICIPSCAGKVAFVLRLRSPDPLVSPLQLMLCPPCKLIWTEPTPLVFLSHVDASGTNDALLHAGTWPQQKARPMQHSGSLSRAATPIQ